MTRMIKSKQNKTIDILNRRRIDIGEQTYEMILQTIIETFDELKFAADVNGATNDLMHLIQTRRNFSSY